MLFYYHRFYGGTYNGFKKGLVAQILGIISLVAGVWIGTHFQHLIEPIIIEKVQEKYLSTLSFIILFFTTIIIGAIITKIIEKFINFVQLKFLNKITGVVLGIIKILSFLIIIIFMLESWDTQSFLLKKTTKFISGLYSFQKYWGFSFYLGLIILIFWINYLIQIK